MARGEHATIVVAPPHLPIVSAEITADLAFPAVDDQTAALDAAITDDLKSLDLHDPDCTEDSGPRRVVV